MVPITHKSNTLRKAIAQAIVRVSKPETILAILNRTVPKGDVLECARVAGLFAAKRTADMIPDCHPLPIEYTAVSYTLGELELYIQVEIHTIYKTGDLESAFCGIFHDKGVKNYISNFRQVFLKTSHLPRSEKHISNPNANSACKRLIMYLRWMVRDSKKGVDFGIWKSISPSELYIPLDVHTGTIARKLGILKRTQNDWKTNEELIELLRKFDSIDPAKYDFALFGLGAFEKF